MNFDGFHKSHLLAEVLECDVQMIFDALPEGTVEFGHAFTDFKEDAEGLTISFENKPAVKAKYMVGADGYFSPIREKLLHDGPPEFTVSHCNVPGADKVCKFAEMPTCSSHTPHACQLAVGFCSCLVLLGCKMQNCCRRSVQDELFGAIWGGQAIRLVIMPDDCVCSSAPSSNLDLEVYHLAKCR